MKMQIRKRDCTFFYPLATWEWNAGKNLLIQYVPRITDIQYQVNNASITYSVSDHVLHPSFKVGQEIRLDDTVYYVATIERTVPDDTGTTFLYSLTTHKQDTPVFVTVEVDEI